MEPKEFIVFSLVNVSTIKFLVLFFSSFSLDFVIFVRTLLLSITLSNFGSSDILIFFVLGFKGFNFLSKFWKYLIFKCREFIFGFVLFFSLAIILFLWDSSFFLFATFFSVFSFKFKIVASLFFLGVGFSIIFIFSALLLIFILIFSLFLISLSLSLF